MCNIFQKLALLLLFAGFCSGQSLTPDEAIDRYLTGSRERELGCSDLLFAVQIDASLPKPKKQGSMSGLKVVSRTGQNVYRGLRFTGDKLVKTAVIARFLANDAKPPGRDAGADVTRQNYSFIYQPQPLPCGCGAISLNRRRFLCGTFASCRTINVLAIVSRPSVCCST